MVVPRVISGDSRLVSSVLVVRGVVWKAGVEACVVGVRMLVVMAVVVVV